MRKLDFEIKNAILKQKMMILKKKNTILNKKRDFEKKCDFKTNICFQKIKHVCPTSATVYMHSISYFILGELKRIRVYRPRPHVFCSPHQYFRLFVICLI